MHSTVANKNDSTLNINFFLYQENAFTLVVRYLDYRSLPNLARYSFRRFQ